MHRDLPLYTTILLPIHNVECLFVCKYIYIVFIICFQESLAVPGSAVLYTGTSLTACTMLVNQTTVLAPAVLRLNMPNIVKTDLVVFLSFLILSD